MSFSHLDFTGRGWERALEMVEHRIRASRESENGNDEPEVELPQAEIGDDERRAAMARERSRRAGQR